MNTYYQQGDVLMFPITEIPTKVTEVKGATLALGEFTGHHHTLFDDVMDEAPVSNNPFEMGSTAVKLYQDDTYKYANVLKEVYLKHQEHKPIKIDPGMYKIGIVREVDPFSDEIRSVQD